MRTLEVLSYTDNAAVKYRGKRWCGFYFVEINSVCKHSNVTNTGSVLMRLISICKAIDDRAVNFRSPLRNRQVTEMIVDGG